MLASLAISLGLCVVLLFLYGTTGYSSTTSSVSKASAFECGFEGYMKMRRPFSVRYFILVVLFLILDVETVLFFPCLIDTNPQPLSLLTNMLFFLGVLMLGLLYEWKNNMLDWTT